MFSSPKGWLLVFLKCHEAERLWNMGVNCDGVCAAAKCHVYKAVHQVRHNCHVKMYCPVSAVTFERKRGRRLEILTLRTLAKIWKGGGWGWRHRIKWRYRPSPLIASSYRRQLKTSGHYKRPTRASSSALQLKIYNIRLFVITRLKVKYSEITVKNGRQIGRLI